jgi:hypothetical protein
MVISAGWKARALSRANLRMIASVSSRVPGTSV